MEITDHHANLHAHELMCRCTCMGKAMLAGKPGHNSEKFETV